MFNRPSPLVNWYIAKAMEDIFFALKNNSHLLNFVADLLESICSRALQGTN